jgi:hypothetical protein
LGYTNFPQGYKDFLYTCSLFAALKFERISGSGLWQETDWTAMQMAPNYFAGYGILLLLLLR